MGRTVDGWARHGKFLDMTRRRPPPGRPPGPRRLDPLARPAHRGPADPARAAGAAARARRAAAASTSPSRAPRSGSALYVVRDPADVPGHRPAGRRRARRRARRAPRLGELLRQPPRPAQDGARRPVAGRRGRQRLLRRDPPRRPALARSARRPRSTRTRWRASTRPCATVMGGAVERARGVDIADLKPDKKQHLRRPRAHRRALPGVRGHHPRGVARRRARSSTARPARRAGGCSPTAGSAGCCAEPSDTLAPMTATTRPPRGRARAVGAARLRHHRAGHGQRGRPPRRRGVLRARGGGRRASSCCWPCSTARARPATSPPTRASPSCARPATPRAGSRAAGRRRRADVDEAGRLELFRRLVAHAPGAHAVRRQPAGSPFHRRGARAEGGRGRSAGRRCC